jgi:hypothetical protein
MAKPGYTRYQAYLGRVYHVSTQSPPSGQLTLTSLSSFQKPSTTRDRMHLALRPASQRRALRNEQPWRFLAARLAASSSGHGAFTVRPLHSDCAAYCLQLSLSAFKLSLGVGVGDVLHSWYEITSRRFGSCIRQTLFSRQSCVFQLLVAEHTTRLSQLGQPDRMH